MFELMRSTQEIEQALDELITEHYYSDDFMLTGVMRSFTECLPARERVIFCDVLLERLAREPTILNVLLCSSLDIPDIVPELTELLNEQAETSQLTRAILSVLKHYKDDAAYRAIERFLDSDQEDDALAALAKIDFVRSIPHLIRMLNRGYIINRCLHIFYERKKEVGLEGLIYELRTYAVANDAERIHRIGQVFASKTGDYNPFSQDEIATILIALQHT